MIVPTFGGNRVNVDSKGRVVLPQHVRERLGITPGSEVEIRERDGKAVVEHEDEPEVIVEDLEALIDEATAEREQTPYDDLDAQVKDQVDTIRRQSSGPEAGDE